LKIIDYLPPVLRDIGDFAEIANAEQAQFDAFDAARGGMADDLFLTTLTENGAKRWESIMNITSKGTDSLETRKFRILVKFNEQTPYTMAALREKLANLCGEDGYTAVLDAGTYTLTVRVALTAKGFYDEVDALLKRVVPANLIVDLSLLYNTWDDLEGFNRSCDLWDILNYTWDEIETCEMYTLGQMLSNGNFANGFAGWSALNAGTPTVSGGVCTFTATVANGVIYEGDRSVISDHEYYGKAGTKPTTGTTNVRIRLYDTATDNIIAATAPTTDWQTLSGVVTATATANAQFMVKDSRASGWDAVRVKNCMLIDLTKAFGAGNEPTAAEMDAIFEAVGIDYFDGAYKI